MCASPAESRAAEDPAPFITPARDGVRVAVRLTPNAKREEVTGFDVRENGAPRCRVAVAAPPVEGRANAALLKLLAKEWGVPKSTLSIAAGVSGRDKLVHIAGDPLTLLSSLQTWKDRIDG